MAVFLEGDISSRRFQHDDVYGIWLLEGISHHQKTSISPSHITCLIFLVTSSFSNCHLFLPVFTALGSSGRAEDQVPSGASGGDSDEEAGDQAETL